MWVSMGGFPEGLSPGLQESKVEVARPSHGSGLDLAQFSSLAVCWSKSCQRGSPGPPEGLDKVWTLGRHSQQRQFKCCPLRPGQTMKSDLPFKNHTSSLNKVFAGPPIRCASSSGVPWLPGECASGHQHGWCAPLGSEHQAGRDLHLTPPRHITSKFSTVRQTVTLPQPWLLQR